MPFSCNNFEWGKPQTILFLWMVMLFLPCISAARLPKVSALFVFGDSFSDTGNLVEAFPFRSEAENLPYGSTFFGAPSGRYSDGRLIADFLASDMDIPFLNPYFKNIEPHYHHGINFAVSGATACDIIDATSGATSCNITAEVPFSLQFQTQHFMKFKQNVIAASGCLDLNIPPLDAFRSGLYLIFIGTNDMLNAFLQLSATVDNVIDEAVKAISKAIKDLYAEEARDFMVFNVPPAGCFPTLLSMIGNAIPKDSLNCSIMHNQVVQKFNAELHKALHSLQKELGTASIRRVDLYQFMIDAITHPENYGLDKTKTLSACLGGDSNQNNFFGGKTQKVTACSRPDKYISWDGVHFTDAFSGHFVQEIVFKGNYVHPPLDFARKGVRKGGSFE